MANKMETIYIITDCKGIFCKACKSFEDVENHLKARCNLLGLKITNSYRNHYGYVFETNRMNFYVNEVEI